VPFIVYRMTLRIQLLIASFAIGEWFLHEVSRCRCRWEGKTTSPREHSHQHRLGPAA